MIGEALRINHSRKADTKITVASVRATKYSTVAADAIHKIKQNLCNNQGESTNRIYFRGLRKNVHGSQGLKIAI